MPASTLYLMLPPRPAGTLADWSPEIFDGCAYALADDAYIGLKQQGTAGPHDLPDATTLILIAAACDVTLTEVKIPPLSPAKLKLALPGLAEDALAQDVVHCHLVLDQTTVSGKEVRPRTLAAIDRGWMRFICDIFGTHKHHKLKILPAQLCLPQQTQQTTTALNLTHHAEGEEETLLLTVRCGTLHGYGMRLALPHPSANRDQTADAVHWRQIVQPWLPTDVEAPLASPGVRQRWPQAGLRELDWSTWIAGIREAQIDLCQQEFASRHVSSGLTAWRPTMALVASLLLVYWIGMQVNWWQLRSQRNALLAQIQNVLHEVMPDVKTTGDTALLYMRRHVDQLRTASGKLAPDDFSVLGEQFAQLMRGAPADALKEIEYRNGTLWVTLRDGIDGHALARQAATQRMRMKNESGTKWRLQPAS